MVSSLLYADGGADTPHVHDQNSMTIKPQVDTSSKSPGLDFMPNAVLCVMKLFRLLCVCSAQGASRLLKYRYVCDGPAQSSSLAHQASQSLEQPSLYLLPPPTVLGYAPPSLSCDRAAALPTHGQRRQNNVALRPIVPVLGQNHLGTPSSHLQGTHRRNGRQ